MTWKRETHYSRFYFYFLSFTVSAECFESLDESDVTRSMINGRAEMPRPDKDDSVNLTISPVINVAAATKDVAGGTEDTAETTNGDDGALRDQCDATNDDDSKKEFNDSVNDENDANSQSDEKLFADMK